jgi:hypothetical protein
MSNRIVTTHEAPPLGAETRNALLACGLWMRAAFVGASATAVGVIQLFNGEWSALSALSTTAAGIALVGVSWRRAHAALRNGDKPAATVPGATPAAAHH